jgi:hypothetical protein
MRVCAVPYCCGSHILALFFRTQYVTSQAADRRALSRTQRQLSLSLSLVLWSNATGARDVMAFSGGKRTNGQPPNSEPRKAIHHATTRARACRSVLAALVPLDRPHLAHLWPHGKQLICIPHLSDFLPACLSRSVNVLSKQGERAPADASAPTAPSTRSLRIPVSPPYFGLLIGRPFGPRHLGRALIRSTRTPIALYAAGRRC